MTYPELPYSSENGLELDQFKEMDYFAVNHYDLPVELMMENAGLHLAHLVASVSRKNQLIKIGVGNGNNGGGGLVAARRLSAWGYKVFIDVFTELTKELVVTQFERALKFGAVNKNIKVPDVWVDAYLGFSQQLPLNKSLLSIIEEASNSAAIKISLDIPTGFVGDSSSPFFKADKILTLAAPKKTLYHLNTNIEIYLADLGIPQEVYKKFGSGPFPFDKGPIIKLV